MPRIHAADGGIATEPTASAHAPAAAAASPYALRSVVNVPAQSALAAPLAVAVGAGIGSALALAFQGLGNLLPGTSLGAVMGLTWLGALRWIEQGHVEQRRHQERVQMVSTHPQLSQLLRAEGGCLHDRGAVKQLCDRLDRDVRVIQDSFKKHCGAYGLTPAPLMGDVLRTFFLHHCADRGIVVISRGSTQECYLVAAYRKDHPRVRDAISRVGASPPDVLRRLGCPFMRVDLVNTSMRDAQGFEVEMHRLEWTATPTHGQQMQLPVGAPDVIKRSGRRPRRTLPAQEPASGSIGHAHPRPGVDDGTAAGSNRIDVARGARLLKQLAPYDPQGRTWQDVRSIEQWLRTGREIGHPVRFDGELYLSADVHLDGRRGRNVMRLLYLKEAHHRYALVRIVNYHDVRLQHGSRSIAPQPTRAWRP
jgi:hypothetical protein